MPHDRLLVKVRAATTRRGRAESAWRDAIRDAVKQGRSLRTIAEAAGVTHVRVLRISQQEPPDPIWAYHKSHRKVERARGKAKECSRCGTTDPDKLYEWANLTGNYEDVWDYRRLCRSCHRKYDRERRE